MTSFLRTGGGNRNLSSNGCSRNSGCERIKASLSSLLYISSTFFVLIQLSKKKYHRNHIQFSSFFSFPVGTDSKSQPPGIFSFFFFTNPPSSHDSLLRKEKEEDEVPPPFSFAFEHQHQHQVRQRHARPKFITTGSESFRGLNWCLLPTH